MEHLLIGLTVGIIMGLTGAGGALVSIPLFIYFLDASIKEATVLSLIAVIFGTLVNLFDQKHKIDNKVVALFVIFGALSNYLSLPLKKILPDTAIAGLLFLIGLCSLWSVWQKKKVIHKEIKPAGPIKSSIIGMGLGLVTTLTGLGGGVLLVPILISFYGKSYEEALPSSLMTILLISTLSFLFQFKTGIELITLNQLSLIGIGALTAFYILKYSLKKISSHKVENIRKIIFSLVTVYSIGSVLIKSIKG